MDSVGTSAHEGAPARPDPGAGHVRTLHPLSTDLVTAALDRLEVHYVVDEDGDATGSWDDCVIWFLRLGPAGDVLQVRTLAAATFTVDDVPRLRAFCNSWNHQNLWPKAYVHVADDGEVSVVGDVSVRWAAGVSAEQCELLLSCGIATGCQLAEAVGELAR